MLAPISISTLLLLASATVAQETPSVVTEIPSTLTVASEDVFTIQTSIPGTSACYEVCIQEPCPACSVEGSMGIPPGETPIFVSDSAIASIITDPILSTVSGFMSIPAGETPFSPIVTRPGPPSSGANTATPTSNAAGSTSAPAEQTSNAAALLRVGESVPLVLAAALALL